MNQGMNSEPKKGSVWGWIVLAIIILLVIWGLFALNGNEEVPADDLDNIEEELDGTDVENIDINVDEVEAEVGGEASAQ